MSAPCAVVAAPASGSGKTLVTLGILRALRRRGLKVGSFKVGPDYIDAAFHAAATGEGCYNLDGWAMRFDTLAGLIEDAGRGCDFLLGEGVMGLFDGALDGSGATADLAALFGLPVVLVVDAARMGASVAALIDGFRRHREDVEVTAVVLNRVGSPVHADLLLRACFEHLSTPVLGCLAREDGLGLPSRHLGLVQALEHPELERFLDHAAARIEAQLDLDRLLRLAAPPSISLLGPDVRPMPPLGRKIAVAQDVAFGFVYRAVLEGWRRHGIELAPFSPLADEAPAGDADAVYLPGGYPELHAGLLAGNARFLGGLRAAAARGAWIYGECGGYMVLGEALVDGSSAVHAMAGLLPVVTSFAEPRRHLGYRRIELLAEHVLGEAGAGFRGHEFHHAREVERRGEHLFSAATARGEPLGPQGCRVGRCAGSFLHLIDRA